MKIIKLYGVHYLSQNGILLNSENNFVEATEENILKLHKFIENKYVKVVELDENGKEIVEEKDENEVINEQLKELFEEKNNKTEETEKTEDIEEKQPVEEEKVEKKSKKASKK